MDKSRKGIIRSGLNLISIAAVLVLFFAIGTSYAADRVEYCHTDALGSVIASTDESGNVLWRESYRPFGDRMLKEVSTQDNTPFYTGKPHDDATGLSYFGARYYDPNLGRFLGVDPAGVDSTNLHSFNRYAYANNNPYKYVDPDGRDPDFVMIIDSGAYMELRGAELGVDVSTRSGTDVVMQQMRTEAYYEIGGYVFGSLIGKVAGAVKLVPKSVKPAISPQKQAGHIPGTPQNTNRLKQGKPTSSFFGEKSGNRLTRQAFEKGKLVPGRPNVRENDFGVSTGTGPNGGMQSRVRVHQDSGGSIHGHPSGPERF